MNEIIIAFLTALVGGLIGTYGGARFLNLREDYKMKKVRAIAIKALDVIKKYSKQSYMNAESDFNTSLSSCLKIDSPSSSKISLILLPAF